MNNDTRMHMGMTIALCMTLAVVYLFIMDLRVVDGYHITWDSEIGYILMVPPLCLVGYSWVVMAVLCIADDTQLEDIMQVRRNDGDWRAKAVYYRDKHAGLVVNE